MHFRKGTEGGQEVTGGGLVERGDIQAGERRETGEHGKWRKMVVHDNLKVLREMG